MRLTGIEETTIQQYELGNSFPYFTSLISLSSVLRYSVDFFLFNGNTSYIKNIKLLELASQLDNDKMLSERYHTEVTTQVYLKKIKDKTLAVSMDTFDLKLTDNFRKNLKIIRESKKLSQSQLGKIADLSSQVISRYEKDRYPPSEKFRILSKALNVSAHCLCTGEKLYFHTSDSHFCKTMLMADHYLSLEEHKFLISLMETLLQNAGIDPKNKGIFL